MGIRRALTDDARYKVVVVDNDANGSARLSLKKLKNDCRANSFMSLRKDQVSRLPEYFSAQCRTS